MSDKKPFNTLIEGEQPVLVDFYATWCGPCKSMNPILEETAKQLGVNVKIIKVDIDKNPSVADHYKVKGVPTLILFHKGQTLWRRSGVVPTHQLVQEIKEKID